MSSKILMLKLQVLVPQKVRNNSVVIGIQNGQVKITFLQANLNLILPKVLISSYEKIISRHKKELQPQAKK